MKKDNPSEATKPAMTTVQVGIRMHPVQGSERPVLANFAMVQGMTGTVFVDFGFLEPQALTAITRAGRAVAKPSEPVVGQLACRVAMDLQTASQLARQLNDLLRSAAHRAAAPAAADAAATPQ